MQDLLAGGNGCRRAGPPLAAPARWWMPSTRFRPIPSPGSNRREIPAQAVRESLDSDPSRDWEITG